VGYADWNVRVAGKPVTGRIYPKDVEKFTTWDTSFVRDLFPSKIDVLTIHGLADNVVPPYDAVLYAGIYGDPERSPGRHTLHFVEDADHNFSGRHDEVIETILGWLDLRKHGNVSSTGIWKGQTRL